MTDTKFTPGPWKTASGSPEYICTGHLWLASTMGVTGTDEARANARLIAASPALYEALEQVLAEKAPAYHDCIDNGEAECAWCIARAALALARGDE
ncbi:hypothetical protein [Sphingomonas sp. 10B4]|uniref:hypothetical protein n=1 Tax=Sphingomonas sp. 10B4 TaxID=3048575 RepID=UPI002AB3BDC1|nr:hypothetical protein [Sphingomonas sp. 10B4]MDY7525521.1 hypothetical protein [Sphingomonas sp. 10B4]MEB0281467.1 hypothetical protein [Sphingomonas sp. 10B4]